MTSQGADFIPCDEAPCSVSYYCVALLELLSRFSDCEVAEAARAANGCVIIIFKSINLECAPCLRRTALSIPQEWSIIKLCFY